MIQRNELYHIHKKSWYVAAVLLFLLIFALFPENYTVHAHATLVEMEPAEDVVAEDAPSSLTLTFNEPIEHDLAMVTVYDSNAKPVFTGNPDDGVEKSPKLNFAPPELEDGTYTVKWNVVSADGHPVGGSYAFAVGEPTEGGVKTVDENDESETSLVLARIVPEALVLVAAGLFWFGWLAERRSFPGVGTVWRKGRLIAAALLIIGTIAEFITYGLSLPPGIIEVILNGRWELLQQFPFIIMLVAQLLLLILVFIPGMMQGWYLAVWALLAATPSFGGHVWGMKEPFVAIIPRVFHQLAIAFWLGALAYFILVLIWQKKQDNDFSWKSFRAFFVSKMIVASGLVVISGVVMVYLQAGVKAIFTDWKTWSAIVVIKIILTAVMGAIALIQTSKWKRIGTFTTGRLIRWEWGVGLLVLILGVWLSQIAYPIKVETYQETLNEEQVEAEVAIDKLQMGDRNMTAEIPEVDGEQPEDVQVQVSMPQHDMGSDELTAEETEKGHYAAELPFTMSGTWLVEITATYPEHQKVEWTDEVFIAGEGN